MALRTGIITMEGNPLTLSGNEVALGKTAPDFTVVGNTMHPVVFSTLPKGKVYIINVVPSLDTPVCSMQVRRFNTEAAALGNDIAIMAISMDLPFAQARWCGAEGIDKVTTYSDYKDASFGEAFGMLIKELRLLARGVFIVDKEGAVAYSQLVPEITHEPNYDAVLAAAKELL